MYDIYFDLTNMHRTVEESDSGDSGEKSDGAEYWHIGETFDFDFIEEYVSKEDTDDYAVIVKKYGCTCTNCGEFYPDAEVVSAFKCWSCRNF